MITKKTLITVALALVMCMLFALPCFATNSNTNKSTDNVEDLDDVVSPIVELINNLFAPVLAVVGAAGTLYCVVLGVKYARAEEPQDREKAKQHLKSAIIGFVLIFVLIVVLGRLTPVMTNWVTKYQ